jgi:hypothetical protein
VEVDGLWMHSAVGTLSTLDASHRMPVSAIMIDPLITDPVEVEIICPEGLTQTRQYAVAIAWTLSRFYAPAESRPHARDLIGGLIGYINCVLPFTQVEGSGQLEDALKYAGIRPIWRIATPWNIQTFMTEEVYRFLRMFPHESMLLFAEDRNQQLGLLGLLLLLIGKSVTTQGYAGWVNNRLKTFRGILGIPEDQFIWTIGVVPLQPVLASLSTFLSANQPLRTRLYHIYM